MDLSEIGEFGLIRRIQQRFPSSPLVPLGMGDDAAALRPPSIQNHLLVTTDSLLEGIHFESSLSPMTAVGYKAVMVNVSDVAAMGGAPRYFLISLALTSGQSVEAIDMLYRGMAKAARETGLALVGGNTTFAKDNFSIGVTLLGEVPKKEMVTRAGAREGDLLYVTGTLGDAAAGLALLKEGKGARTFARLARRHQAPSARWREGRLLAKSRIASAMIDISDGLSSDLFHLMERSGVGAELDLARIPLSAALKRRTLQIGADPLEYALNGGEDYELLFSVPGKMVEKLEALIRRGDLKARPIGRIVQEKKGLVARDRTGRTSPLTPGGYDHFKKR